MNPEYPVYIVSKGRWESRLTAKALDAMAVPYHIVVEPQEHDNYATVIDPAKILILPFSNLGQGSIPARNWIWDHALSIGAKRHWILDDNIRWFARIGGNKKTQLSSGVCFLAVEKFVDQYENIALAGLQYEMFVPAREKCRTYILNTRIYSCILIKNDLPYRWRGRYNEDTDLSLRILKDGWCTFLCQEFVCKKTATMTMKGGNTDQLYIGNGRRLMAESLMEQHPDVVEIVWKWNRWQHKVDYLPFKCNKLKPKNGIMVPWDTSAFRLKVKTRSEWQREKQEREGSSIGSNR